MALRYLHEVLVLHMLARRAQVGTKLYICTCMIMLCQICDDLDALNCSNGEVRLALGSPSEREGRVEICYEGVWGSVTDNSWSHQDAAVVCQQLNFEAIGECNINACIIVWPGKCLCRVEF